MLSIVGFFLIRFYKDGFCELFALEIEDVS